VVSGGRTWHLEYTLGRHLTPGGGPTIRLHCRACEEGPGALPERVAVDLGPDPRQALRIFRRVVAGAAFPAHVRDVIADVRGAASGRARGALGPVVAAVPLRPAAGHAVPPDRAVRPQRGAGPAAPVAPDGSRLPVPYPWGIPKVLTFVKRDCPGGGE
jgi:hypothetical protein